MFLKTFKKTVGTALVATLGLGVVLPVNNLTTFDVSSPDILITAMPDTPGPLDKA